MGNIFDYLDWRGDLDFTASGLNEVDQLILSGLSYSRLQGIAPEGFENFRPLAEIARQYHEDKRDDPKTMQMFGDLLPALAKTRRFSGLELGAYRDLVDNKRETQFCAMTVRLPQSHFISYRGTDATLAGWKEDFNLSFMTEVPAQQMAVQYLDEAATKLAGPLLAGGHSKGGNLAVYAAARCAPETQARLDAVYNNDGPGFLPEFLRSTGYLAIRERAFTLLPFTAIVGLLLEHSDISTIVSTTQKGLFQHDFYKWEVLGPDFVRAASLRTSSQYMDKTLNQWIAELDPAGRERFFDALYSVVAASGATTLEELSTNWLSNSAAILKSALGMDDDLRQQVFKVLGELVKVAGRNMGMLWSTDKDVPG